ncbi:HNH endonuclease [Mesorhizobium sp. M0189]|uniref:HNH endonuclease n=1 Tax=Mesorhizobium sp. M0189 TaxID=2956909 RepID=UPI00333BFA2A
MEVIKDYGKQCQCCGSRPGETTVAGKPVRIVVDHIKPISRYWHLRLTKSNLQILCAECNMGKGTWDETDHRPIAANDEADVDPMNFANVI